jgi:hypothetical protein
MSTLADEKANSTCVAAISRNASTPRRQRVSIIAG